VLRLLGFLFRAALAFTTLTFGIALGFATAFAFTTFTLTVTFGFAATLALTALTLAFGFFHLAAAFTFTAAAFSGLFSRRQAVAAAQLLRRKGIAGSLHIQRRSAQQHSTQGSNNSVQMIHGNAPMVVSGGSRLAATEQ
jgi:hypothetical protein